MAAPGVKRRARLHLRKLAEDAAKAIEAEQKALLETAAAVEREAREAEQRKVAARKAADAAAKVKADAAKASSPRRTKKEEK